MTRLTPEAASAFDQALAARAGGERATGVPMTPARELPALGEEEIAEAKRLIAGATEGPWFIRPRPTDDGLSVIEDGRQHGLFPITGEHHDISLIVFAANNLPRLLAEIEALRAERDALIRSTGEHVTVRGEYYARATAAEALVSSQAETIKRLREDAERWQALMSSQRMHFMGSAGFTYVMDPPDSNKWKDVVAVKPKDDGDWLHFGMEFWDKHKAFGDPKYPDNFERLFLTTYVDELRRRAALSDTSPAAAAPAQEGGR